MVVEFRDYDDEELNHLQNIELMILKDVVDLLDKHDLKYYLYGGTLLGAIRHGGFIPWDDDIDIMLFREDFDKALIILKNELPEKYELIQMDYVDDCFGCIAKVSLKNTIFGRWYSSYVDYDLGIFIDLFPLDNIPNNDFLGKLLHKGHFFCYQFVINSCIKVDMYTKFRTFLHHAVYHILNFIPINRRTWKKLLTKQMTLFSYKETDRVIAFLHRKYAPFKREDFEPATTVKFEDFEFKIPKNYDDVLKQIYGDYMTIPSKENRANSAPDVIDFGEY